MCCSTGDRPARDSVEAAGTTSAEKLIGRVRPGRPFVLALDVYVSAAATVELRTPRGGVVYTTTTTGAGTVYQAFEAMALPAYELVITPSAGTVEYQAALHASK